MMPVAVAMRHRRRVRDKAFDPTQRFGEAEAFEAVDETANRGFSAGQFKGNEGAESVLLLPSDRVAGMTDAARIVKP